ncbi:MAG: S8 family serine peptidase [Ruminococcus sp.]|nr:S8 family serine peptidase [Ruminococcus sp.]
MKKRKFIFNFIMKNKIFFVLVSILIIVVVFTIDVFNDKTLSEINEKQYTSEIVANIRKKYPGLTGENIKIGIIDSCIDNTHDDLIGSIKKTVSFISKNNKSNVVYSNHGTQVAGIISAKDNDFGIIGIAPKAEIYSLVAIHSNGIGEIEDVCSALRWCIENKMDVINLSFSTKISNPELESLVNEAYKQNTIIVASYNNKKNVSSFPAEYDNVIGVKTNNKSWFDFNNNVVYAPGKSITTIDKGGYEYVEGNSMAAACVTGFAAIVKEDCNKKSINFSNSYFIKQIEG